MNKRAQGTIEYLIIIAIVVVIALVVVSLMSGFLDNSGDVTDNTGEISKNSSVALIISEGISDPDGNTLISIKNNELEQITITSIKLDDVDQNYNKKLLPRDSSLFAITSSGCACNGQIAIDCTYEIDYTTKKGFEKSDTIETVIECVEDSVTTETITQAIDTVSPTFSSISPVDDAVVDTNLNAEFSFIVSDNQGTISSCTFSLDGNLLYTNTSVTNNTTVTFDANLPTEKDYNWVVNCSDPSGNAGTIDQNVNYTP